MRSVAIDMLGRFLHRISFHSLKAAEFRLWLREEKGKVGKPLCQNHNTKLTGVQYIDELSGDSARK